MTEFDRVVVCDLCGREFVVTRTSANPGSETQLNVAFTCKCAGTLKTLLPGSANRQLVRIEPKTP